MWHPVCRSVAIISPKKKEISHEEIRGCFKSCPFAYIAKTTGIWISTVIAASNSHWKPMERRWFETESAWQFCDSLLTWWDEASVSLVPVCQDESGIASHFMVKIRLKNHFKNSHFVLKVCTLILVSNTCWIAGHIAEHCNTDGCWIIGMKMLHWNRFQWYLVTFKMSDMHVCSTLVALCEQYNHCLLQTTLSGVAVHEPIKLVYQPCQIAHFAESEKGLWTTSNVMITIPW